MNIIFKILIFWWSFRAFLERKVFIKNINKNDLVLDVGSGDKPFWRADVIIDKYLNDNQQRNSGSVIFDSKKLFVKADVEDLPFKDKVFDFVFCSHLLEHVENPDKAIRELTRVSKRGYIEVPNVILDIFKPFPSHLWFCEYENKTLIFHQKEDRDDFYFKNIKRFGDLFFDKSIFQYILAQNYKSIFISLYWENSINFKIEKTKNPYVYNSKKSNEEKSFINKAAFLAYITFYKIITFIYYKKKSFELKSLLK